ncbi:hypothetical protein ASPSYDRAFT_662266 [Aspergillus sydowii CBS 593.65]|uniref:Uncharacterized protein n=1 Tax=Aspergillus sydowii CBS 593.65 TaxID=1036612 RepID=A0A1L9TTI9_9EURO|nr:uncharacterized protein ASPSYDRAFT_662266 [Aspergillus sydowii CBS 593.65]OJJ62744.1 hypothetical protein ASPSYDRAFT_662266 [Aspergillus sydowii CBS 593.65]
MIVDCRLQSWKRRGIPIEPVVYCATPSVLSLIQWPCHSTVYCLVEIPNPLQKLRCLLDMEVRRFLVCRASLAIVIYEYSASLCRYTHSGDDWHHPCAQVESKQATWRQICICENNPSSETFFSWFVLTSISVPPHRPQQQWRN